MDYTLWRRFRDFVETSFNMQRYQVSDSVETLARLHGRSYGSWSLACFVIGLSRALACELEL